MLENKMQQVATMFGKKLNEEFTVRGKTQDYLKKTKFYYLARIDIYYLFTHKAIIPTQEKELKLPKKAKSIKEVKTKFIVPIIIKNQI